MYLIIAVLILFLGLLNGVMYSNSSDSEIPAVQWLIGIVTGIAVGMLVMKHFLI